MKPYLFANDMIDYEEKKKNTQKNPAITKSSWN